MQNNILDLITELKYILYLQSKGGQGSGGWGHDGVPGKHGGSKAGSGGLHKIGLKPGAKLSSRRDKAKKVTRKKRQYRQEDRVFRREATKIRKNVLKIHKVTKDKLTGIYEARDKHRMTASELRERSDTNNEALKLGNMSQNDHEKQMFQIWDKREKLHKKLDDSYSIEQDNK